MPTNNPQPQTPSPSGSRIGTEHSSNLEGRVERGAERVERGIEQLATTAADRVREAREQATSGITQQRDFVAQRIRRIGDVLREGSTRLGEEDALAQNLLDLTSERVERLANYVNDATPSMLSDDLQRVARRRPGLFFGGAFLLGLAVGRFVRSSTKTRTGEEFDVEIEDDIEYNAGRFERPYPGRPLTSSSPTSDAAAPGSGATSSPYSGGSSYTGGSASSYTGSSSSETRSYGSSPTTSNPSTSSYGTRPSAGTSTGSLSGSAAGSGTLPPPPPPYGAGTGSTASPSNPVRTPSASPVGSSGNATTNEPHETQRGQGAKS